MRVCSVVCGAQSLSVHFSPTSLRKPHTSSTLDGIPAPARQSSRPCITSTPTQRRGREQAMPCSRRARGTLGALATATRKPFFSRTQSWRTPLAFSASRTWSSALRCGHKRRLPLVIVDCGCRWVRCAWQVWPLLPDRVGEEAPPAGDEGEDATAPSQVLLCGGGRWTTPCLLGRDRGLQLRVTAARGTLVCTLPVEVL
jgi:hypothetical protein